MPTAQTNARRPRRRNKRGGLKMKELCKNCGHEIGKYKRKYFHINDQRKKFGVIRLSNWCSLRCDCFKAEPKEV